jgi:hypothetical protein
VTGSIVCSPPINGNAVNASTAHFTGFVDEVFLYNRALTGKEILDIYNADVIGKDVTRPYFTSPSRLPNKVVGASYSQPLTTVLGSGPVVFSLSVGVLPPGIGLSSTGLARIIHDGGQIAI